MPIINAFMYCSRSILIRTTLRQERLFEEFQLEQHADHKLALSNRLGVRLSQLLVDVLQVGEERWIEPPDSVS